MALRKRIELDNGIVLSYHRIISINKITNNQTIIEIASYTTENKREIEKEAIANNEPFDVYIHGSYVIKEYNETDTIEDLYGYLKTLDEFYGAEDC